MCFWRRYNLTIVNGLARRALLIVPLASGQYFEKKAARATSKKFGRVTSVKDITCACNAMHYWAAPRIFSQPHSLHEIGEMHH